MPPFLPRRNRESTPPHSSPPSKKRGSTKKPTLFDTADRSTPAKSIDDNKRFIDSLNASDNSSSLSEPDSSDFEDVLPSKKVKTSHEESEDDEVRWEDALQPSTGIPATSSAVAGDLELTLTKGMNMGSLTDPHDTKKGPTKIERQVRVATHCMHVQFLMWHNWSRSAWANDKEVQKILVGKLDDVRKKAVEDWKRRAGLDLVEEKETPKANGKAKGRGRPKKGAKKEDARNQRDWGNPAVRLESGKADLSSGDPIIKLLETLAAWWKKNFRISAPGLRKIGYKPLKDLQDDLASFQNDSHNPEEHGEKIDGVGEFQACAKKLEGSRDVGAQLFTALVRGLGIEARLVASLQPVGFGWNKVEEAHPKKPGAKPESEGESDVSSSEETGGFLPKVKPKKPAKQKETLQKSLQKPPRKLDEKAPKSVLFHRRPTRGAKAAAPIELSDDSSELSDPPEQSESEASVIDVTPARVIRKPNARYDRDMPVPNYWTEVIAPSSQQIIPVDSVVNQKVVLKDEDKFASFEPRGKKAEKAKQVFAYIIAFSSDGTAKDVTTRYLKRYVWPGKTKGMRMPIEKVPVYNRRGKVKRYEQYDWFKTIISGYRRPDHLRLPIDDVEDATDLKPVKPEKKPATEGAETLQGYKQSAEYVLERHLRREEALVPTAKPVKTFTHGKGDIAQEDPVYRRKDVVACKTAESWHKEGRQIKPAMQPMKKVPVRAVTLTRKLEIEQTERETGEKATQGMYSKAQTEYIIPLPIENGVIPKNAYGNIDCFVDSMVPEGAAHVPYRGTVRVCKRLGIDYAEAVTGFEFGNKRAVPVTQGVVVAEENAEMVLEELQKDEKEKRIKEEGKREKVALSTWRKLLMGLRIVERVREEYGNDVSGGKDEVNPFTNRSRIGKGKDEDKGSDNDSKVADIEMGKVVLEEDGEDEDEEMGGGFLVED